VSAVLKIQAVADAGRMRQRCVDFTAVPGVDVGGLVQHAAGDAGTDPVRVVAVVIEDQHRIAAGGLHQFLQCVQLDAVELMHAAL